MKIGSDFTIRNQKSVEFLKVLLIVSIILIPVDNLPYLSNLLGELSVRGTVYPFILIILLIAYYSFKEKEIYFVKDIEIKFLLLFLAWVFLCTLINIPGVLDNHFKGRSGISKVVLQFMVIGFVVLVSYCTDIIIYLNKLTLKKIRKYILFSLIPVFIYGTIELINLLNLIDMSKVLEGLSNIFQTYHRGEVYTKGIRTITGEVSYFGMYASFVMPWIASYLFTEKGLKNKLKYGAVFSYLLILLLFSKSRTAYAIILLQICLFTLFILVFKVNKVIKRNLIIGVVSLGVIFTIMNSTVLNKYSGDVNSVNKISIKTLANSLMDPNNMSNIARSGMQMAAIEMGKDNPIFGVGVGQYGFLAKDYVTEKAKTSNEVQRWIDGNEEAWSPAFSLYPRIIAEEGFVGIILWIAFLGLILYRAIKKLWKKENDIIGISLVVSFIGILIAWFNADTFAQMSFWVMLPIIIRYNNSRIN